MFRWRLISAAIILSAILLLIWLDFRLGMPTSLDRPGLLLLPCVLIIGLLASNEILYFSQTNSNNVRHWSVYVGTALVIICSFAPMLWASYPEVCAVGPMGWALFGMATAVGLAFVSQMIGYQQGQPVSEGLAKSIFVIAYIGLLLSFWAPLRLYQDNAWGMVALLSLFVPVKMSDTMAYTFGKSFGRHKLAPNLSPGKTVEGLLGGLLGGCVGALIVFFVLAPWITGSRSSASWVLVVVFGLVVTLAGVFGDLAESLLKRDSGVKNSSKWLLGLGGVMDIIDSVLGAAPVAVAFWSTGLFGPAD